MKLEVINSRVTDEEKKKIEAAEFLVNISTVNFKAILEASRGKAKDTQFYFEITNYDDIDFVIPDTHYNFVLDTEEGNPIVYHVKYKMKNVALENTKGNHFKATIKGTVLREVL